MILENKEMKDQSESAENKIHDNLAQTAQQSDNDSRPSFFGQGNDPSSKLPHSIWCKQRKSDTK